MFSIWLQMASRTAQLHRISLETSVDMDNCRNLNMDSQESNLGSSEITHQSVSVQIKLDSLTNTLFMLVGKIK